MASVLLTPVPKGMFIFSKAMNHPEDLNQWAKWFASKNIRTHIVNDIHGRFYLCREGVEAIDSRITQHLERKKKLTKTEIEILGEVA
jgi:hypothetical protein